MNNAALVAVLVVKDIINIGEGERLVEFFNNKPQPTLLVDAVEQMTELLDGKPKPSVLAGIKAEKANEAKQLDERNEIDRAMHESDAANKSKSDAKPQK